MESQPPNMSTAGGAGPSVPNGVQSNIEASNRSTTGSSASSRALDQCWQERNLLSLDGGGIRGYWSLLMLERLMNRIGVEEERCAREHNAQLPHDSPLRQTHIDSFWPQAYPQNVTHLDNANDSHEQLHSSQKFLPVHYFDTICGSSTGGLIAIMLGRFRMTVADCLSEYKNLGQRIFGRPRWISQRNMPIVPWPKYSARGLKNVFKDVTHRRCELSARSEHNFNNPTFPTMEGTCNVFVTAIRKSKNRKGLEARTKYIIRSYDNGIFALTRSDTSAARPTLNYGSREAMEIWQVARAATAAPLYFAALKLDNPYSTANMRYYFSDGGFGPANNPCLLGIQELQKVHGSEEHDNVGVVVSVGTAKADSSPGGVNFFVDTVRQLTEEATNANTIAELVESIRQNNYWRFNDLVGLKMELDEWKPNWTFGSRDKCGLTTLETIQNAFNAWALQDVNQTRIQDCARELVARRRARTASTHLWEQYATGATRFRCKHRDCTRTFYTFRDEFEQHFDKKHKGRPNAKEYEDPDFLRWIYPPKA